MRKSVALLGLFAALLTVGVGTWLIQAQEDRSTWESKDGQAHVRLPEFVWKALSSPHAKKANFWTGPDGQLLRYTVYVERGGIPDWVHAMADERLGKGEDLEFELEVYPDGSNVYEIYRKIDGLEKQLSVKADRSLFYIGTEQPADKLPEPVSSVIRDMKDLKISKCVFKEGKNVSEYHLKATRDGVPCRIRISKAGRLIAIQRRIPADVEVPFTR